MDDRAGRRRTLLLSIRDGSAWTTMEKFATEYLSAFVVALGFVGDQLSYLLTLPQAITALVQMGSQELIARFGRLRVLADGVFAQAVSLALIIAAGVATAEHALSLQTSLWVLVALFSAYYAAAAIAGNAWVSLMGDTIPERARARYFGMRTRVNSITAVAALIGAGAIVQYSTLGVFAFFVLFGIGVLARLYSFSLVSRSYDPGGEQLPRTESFTLLQFVRKFRTSNFVRYASFSALFWLAIYLSAPFVAYYELEVLRFSYVQYTLLKIVFILGSIISLKYFARVCDEYGNRTVFFVSAFGIGLYIAGYGTFTHFAAFVVMDSIGGILWAAFNLATANYLFDAVSSRKRALVNGYVTALRGAGILVGGVASAALFGLATVLAPGIGRDAYQLIFLTSGALRVLLVVGFVWLVREVRPVRPASIRDLVFIQVGSGFKTAAHTVFSSATAPIRFAKRRLEEFEERELDEALRGTEEHEK